MGIKTVANAYAYTLIETQAGAIGATLVALHELHGVVAADKVAATEQRSIGRLVIDQIHPIPSVKRTTTCVTIQ